MKRTRLLIRIFLLVIFSLACNTVTIAVNKGTPTAESDVSTQQIGFNFADQAPEFSEGDAAAPLHLFLHKYRMPDDGFVTGVTYLNDSDIRSEPFDLLILRPDDSGWTVIHRVNLSDDNPPAQTGITVLTLPSPLSVQKNDIFAHWQYESDGAIPMNGDQSSLDGLVVGHYGFRSADVEIGQHINRGGFTGQRDYFINITFSATP